LGYG
jgi:hypothetical protein